MCPFIFHFISFHFKTHSKRYLHTATMKHTAKFFRAYDDTWEYYHRKDVIQKQCQQTLETQELCSIPVLNNYSFSENTLSSATIISKGFFQSETQKALQNSQVEKAFEIAGQYIKTTKRKFFRFLDTETGKIVIVKQLNRFDAAYVFAAKQKLRGLRNIGRGHDLMHITLTISHKENADYIGQYRQFRNKFNHFICFFKRIIKKNIDYISTYEVTTAKDGRFHQHIHLIIIDQGFIPKKTFTILTEKWKKIANSEYIYFRYFSRDRNIDIFSYVMKYVTKEFLNVNLTTILLFSVKGRAYTMSQRLSRLISEKTIDIMEKKYKYIDSFEAQDIFWGYDISDYDPASLTFFFSFLSVEEKTKLLSEAQSLAKARQNEQKEAEEADRRDKEMMKKNGINNIIKIK